MPRHSEKVYLKVKCKILCGAFESNNHYSSNPSHMTCEKCKRMFRRRELDAQYSERNKEKLVAYQQERRMKMLREAYRKTKEEKI